MCVSSAVRRNNLAQLKLKTIHLTICLLFWHFQELMATLMPVSDERRCENDFVCTIYTILNVNAIICYNYHIIIFKRHFIFTCNAHRKSRNREPIINCRILNNLWLRVHFCFKKWLNSLYVRMRSFAFRYSDKCDNNSVSVCYTAIAI